MITLISEILGAVYTLIDDELLYTPLMKDGSYSHKIEDFDYVDHLALLGEEEFIRQEVDRIESLLRGEFSLTIEH